MKGEQERMNSGFWSVLLSLERWLSAWRGKSSMGVRDSRKVGFIEYLLILRSQAPTMGEEGNVITTVGGFTSNRQRVPSLGPSVPSSELTWLFLLTCGKSLCTVIPQGIEEVWTSPLNPWLSINNQLAPRLWTETEAKFLLLKEHKAPQDQQKRAGRRVTRKDI